MPSEQLLSIATERLNNESIMPDIVQFLISLVSSIIVAILTVQISLRKFYSQKWWEKKAEVYSNIVETLAQMEVSTKHAFERLVGFPGTEEQEKAEYERLRKSRDRIEKITNMGAFIISETAHKRLAVLKHELEESKEKADVGRAIDSDWGAIREAIKELRKCAKQDLAPDPWWKFW